ncbi:DUF4097 family beta strand repeat-containing protein [Saccharothrix algeriensis]|uniref:DUF4097 family beta strand repeat protein n=1 Tax=Saccharothrix algeriensis TaxID=173560 RepID=A0A8T8HRI4_9PSEU|nr:DUF4097 family beta strand repeat-containing protein [Saccharothrix algeriensis]MBM7812336.1 hypothetical protein [Saccharothrix algeriensis]QTR01106.1 DUF4097 family beta strand repeat protein [Saccharothrix algeriensis]
MVKRIALAAVVVVAAAGALSSCVRLVQHRFEDRHEVTGAVVAVRIQNGSGDVTLRSRDGGGGAVEVRRTVHHTRDDRPDGVTHRLEGDTLVLDGCGDRCSVDYHVTVPSEDVKVVGHNDSGDVTVERVAAVEVSIGSGDAVVREIGGAVRLENGSGDVTASDVGGEFTGRIGSGNARLTRMSGPVLVDDSSGDIEVEMAAAQRVHAESGSGNVTVRVPRGSYRVRTDAGSGEEAVEVPHDPNATVELVLRSGSGDLALSAS